MAKPKFNLNQPRHYTDFVVDKEENETAFTKFCTADLIQQLAEYKARSPEVLRVAVFAGVQPNDNPDANKLIQIIETEQSCLGVNTPKLRSIKYKTQTKKGIKRYAKRSINIDAINPESLERA